jgi:hypothetical protein
MFLLKFLFWLIMLPFRLVLWLVGLTLWIITLPLRIVFGILGFIGFGRLLQLGFLAAAGYYFYRLVSQSADDSMPPVPEAVLNSTPST